MYKISLLDLLAQSLLIIILLYAFYYLSFAKAYYVSIPKCINTNGRKLPFHRLDEFAMYALDNILTHDIPTFVGNNYVTYQSTLWIRGSIDTSAVYNAEQIAKIVCYEDEAGKSLVQLFKGLGFEGELVLFGMSEDIVGLIAKSFTRARRAVYYGNINDPINSLPFANTYNNITFYISNESALYMDNKICYHYPCLAVLGFDYINNQWPISTA